MTCQYLLVRMVAAKVEIGILRVDDIIVPTYVFVVVHIDDSVVTPSDDSVVAPTDDSVVVPIDASILIPTDEINNNHPSPL